MQRSLTSRSLPAATIAGLLTALLTAGFSYVHQAADRPWRGDNSDLPREFDQALRGYETAWRAKDASALAKLFAEDGFVLPNGNAPVRGRAQIEKHYAGAGGPLHLRAMHWAREGRVGYIIGEYAGTPDFANPGKFTLTMMRGDDERWLIMSDMDNSNTQPRAAQPAP